MVYKNYGNIESAIFCEDNDIIEYFEECLYYGYLLPGIRTIEKYFKESELTAEYATAPKEHERSWINFKRKIRILKHIQVQAEKKKRRNSKEYETYS